MILEKFEQAFRKCIIARRSAAKSWPFGGSIFEGSRNNLVISGYIIFNCQI